MIEERISEILKNFSEKDVRREIKKNNIKIRRRKSEKRFVKELKKFEESRAIFVTDKGFAGEYLKKQGVRKIFSLEREDLKNVNGCKIYAHKERVKIIIGFGGGRALDIAKKVAFDTERKLVLIPTAPSHNGLISRTASLFDNGIKKSFLCRFPKIVIIPFFLWKKAGRHIKAGILDVLASITAVQDVFLSNAKTGEAIKERELKLALFGVKKVINIKSLKNLETALLCGGLAMKESSRYCSGSEHEAEKAIAEKFKEYMHGEIAGVCSLIVAKLYCEKIKQNLIFDSSELFEDLVKIYRKTGVISVVKEILENRKFVNEASKALKTVNTIRPERFTLWNVVNPKEIDFKKLISEIKENL